MQMSSRYRESGWPKKQDKHIFLFLLFFFFLIRLPEEHLKAIQDYLSTQLALDSDFMKTGSTSLPHLKKLTIFLCKELYG